MDNIRIGITQGDINGIGYEMILNTFEAEEMTSVCTPIIYGSPKVATYHRKTLGNQTSFIVIESAEKAKEGNISMVNCFGEDEHKIADLSLASIVILSLATSIDALTIGISFAFVEIDMVFATIAISLAAILFGILGFEIGNRAARFFKSNLPQIIAGIILIAIGIKTIWQPLMP